MLASLMDRLSASEATFWSSICEVIAVVAGVMLLLGLIGEFPESKAWKGSCGYTLAKYAVVLGVAFEIIGGIGVFGTSVRLQQLTDASISQRVTVEAEMLKQLRPRSISSFLHAKLVAGMKGKLEFLPIYIGPHADGETIKYAMDLNTTLSDAGIKVFVVPQRLTSEMEKTIPIPVSGVTLLIKQDVPDFKKTAESLETALMADTGIVNDASTPEPGNQQFVSAPPIALFVMEKPTPFWWFWNDFSTSAFRKPPDWNGDWPPKPPWEDPK